jgi:hypothetical protein
MNGKHRRSRVQRAHSDVAPSTLKRLHTYIRRHMPQPNQLHVRREDVHVTAADLLSRDGIRGAITEKVGGQFLLLHHGHTR